MSPAVDSDSPGPFIAGVEDALTANSSADFKDSPDDSLAAAPNIFDYAAGSPDTLQQFDATRKTAEHSFMTDSHLGFSTPPNEPYHEYSDDSAESSKLSSRQDDAATSDTHGHPSDAAMEFDDFFRKDAPFMSSNDPDGSSAFDLDESQFIDPQAMTLDADMALSSLSPSTLQSHDRQSLVSPGEDFSQTHNRQDSQCSIDSTNGWRGASREVSPMSSLVTSHKTTPNAFHTPSPPAGSTNLFTNGHAVRPDRLDMQAPVVQKTMVPQQPQFNMPVTANAGYPRQLHFPPQQQHRHRQQQQQQQQQRGVPRPPSGFGAMPHYELLIPDSPVKSRVETQISLRLILTPPPPGITKLHLPTQAISKPKLQVRPAPQRSPNMLELSVSVVCTSAMQQPELRDRALQRAMNNPPRHLPPPNDDGEFSPQNGAEVRICSGCMTRERKRAARKRVKNQDDENMWLKDEDHRVIVFNTHEVKEWDSCGELDSHPGALKVDLPLRIACYCRHHGEKLGFNVIFTLKDYQNRPVAQIMSRPIMITDDHKTHPIASLPTHADASVAVSGSNLATPPAARMSQAPTPQPQQGHDVGGSNGSSPRRGPTPTRASPPATNGQVRPARTISRPTSPAQGAPSAKKRKSCSSNPSRVPNSLAMTRMDNASPQAQAPNAQPPFHHGNAGKQQQHQQQQQQQPDNIFSPPANPAHFTGSSPVAVGNEPQQPTSNFFRNGRSSSIDNMSAMAQLYSGPQSAQVSRAPSPNSNPHAMQYAVPQSSLSHAVAGGVLNMSTGAGQPGSAPPVIHKIIPSEGPKVGGVEVTLLGRDFWNGMVVYFGAQQAQTTTFWSSCTVVCLVPPSPAAGIVTVTCDRPPSAAQALDWPTAPVFFRYVDDSENQIMRLALSCIGGKMFGTKDVDIAHVARQLVGDAISPSMGGGQSGDGPSAGGGAMFSRMAAASGEDLETLLLKCLDFIDLNESPYVADLDRRNASGHTMLHLASSLGFRRLVAALLARGANPDEMDNGDCTPLHLAAIHNQPEIARRLTLAGASPRRVNLSDLTPLDLAESGDVARAIRQSAPRRARSHSRDMSQHSRASSVSSFRSLQLPPLSRISTAEEVAVVDDGGESPEYTSGDFEDEDPDEDVYPDLRRPRQADSRQQEADADAAPNTGALAAAFKEQLQQQLNQFQQSMALHLQNLPHLPQMPQMPQIPVIPGYQAYLQQAPFMRRMTQYMPGMTSNTNSSSSPGSRGSDRGHPGGADDDATAKMDSRWWDLSSLMNQAPALPPAYEEIFPRGDGGDANTKQASAAAAAAEAEADAKCAQLYDQHHQQQHRRRPQQQYEAGPSRSRAGAGGERTSSADAIPSILKIGRKNAITREQQEQFLRAREARLKRLSNDRNLFFIWIPLLVLMVCAMLYSYFPSFFPLIWAFIRSFGRLASHKISTLFREHGQVDRQARTEV
ncbi:IPT protein [Geosmithia morbida]|uniref:IPT protein n=1 Tax=Geosmithia morbida TaxID=1094350 RepID=A0A9P4YZ62_9HYPO|nr:IPT protein [Geosmithia morbida]KAF4123704.1 IPT protein [Geosmithia morbida]